MKRQSARLELIRRRRFGFDRQGLPVADDRQRERTV